MAYQRLIKIGAVEDGEALRTFPDASADFVVANHLLQHQDPIGAIASWPRVLRPGGILYLAVPDKRHTFDCDRPVTPLEHLIRDHREGPAWSRHYQFEEWTRLAEQAPEAKLAERMEQLLAVGHSIHFHVWTEAELLGLFLHYRQSADALFGVELFQRNGLESVAVLRKDS